MVKVRNDLTGKTFGMLTVIGQTDDYISKKGKHFAQWLCECNCDEHNRVVVTANNLKREKVQSCGCYKKELSKTRLEKENKYDLSGDFGILWSTNTNDQIYFDLQDAKEVLQHCWTVGSSGYPITVINGQMVSMHKLFGYYRPDHHNRNKLDNRRSNLIQCTRQENQRNRTIRSDNTSGFTGVSFNKNKKKWFAQITADYNKHINLGYFINKEDAVRARLKAEKEYFGEFAPQRHLFEEYNIL